MFNTNLSIFKTLLVIFLLTPVSQTKFNFVVYIDWFTIEISKPLYALVYQFKINKNYQAQCFFSDVYFIP